MISSSSAAILLILLILVCSERSIAGFVVVAPHRSCKVCSRTTATSTTTRPSSSVHQDATTKTTASTAPYSGKSHFDTNTNANTRAFPRIQHQDVPRRHILATMGTTLFSFVTANAMAGASAATAISSTTTIIAADDTTIQQAISAMTPVPMKTFVDPAGLFVLNIPQRFFALRRSAKGDLPDAQTGTGRRGSTIFSAGDMAKAEVVSVEYFPVKVLLQDFGIDAGTGLFQTISDIGESSAVANLISLRRDKDRLGAMATKIVPNSVTVSSDGRELAFQLKTSVPVQKPELLLEQYGVTELLRITSAKASLLGADPQQRPLKSDDKNGQDGSADDNLVMMMVVFASALETDWKGPDGVALQETVQSFRALNPAS